MKRYLYVVFVLFIGALLSPIIVTDAQIATGGAYKLDQAVIANGGGLSNDPVNNLYKVEGTSGQAAAGGNLTGGPPTYALKDGFWAPQAFAPTAANVSVGGRVTLESGNGIRNVLVTLTGGPLTTPRTALSSSFGYFTFDDIEAGHIYVITVSAKRFRFGNPSQAVSVLDSVTDLVFTATAPD